VGDGLTNDLPSMSMNTMACGPPERFTQTADATVLVCALSPAEAPRSIAL